MDELDLGAVTDRVAGAHNPGGQVPAFDGPEEALVEAAHLQVDIAPDAGCTLLELESCIEFLVEELRFRIPIRAPPPPGLPGRAVELERIDGTQPRVGGQPSVDGLQRTRPRLGVTVEEDDVGSLGVRHANVSSTGGPQIAGEAEELDLRVAALHPIDRLVSGSVVHHDDFEGWSRMPAQHVERPRQVIDPIPGGDDN